MIQIFLEPPRSLTLYLLNLQAELFPILQYKVTRKCLTKQPGQGDQAKETMNAGIISSKANKTRGLFQNASDNDPLVQVFCRLGVLPRFSMDISVLSKEHARLSRFSGIGLRSTGRACQSKFSSAASKRQTGP